MRFWSILNILVTIFVVASVVFMPVEGKFGAPRKGNYRSKLCPKGQYRVSSGKCSEPFGYNSLFGK